MLSLYNLYSCWHNLVLIHAKIYILTVMIIALCGNCFTAHRRTLQQQLTSARLCQVLFKMAHQLGHIGGNPFVNVKIAKLKDENHSQ